MKTFLICPNCKTTQNLQPHKLEEIIQYLNKPIYTINIGCTMCKHSLLTFDINNITNNMTQSEEITDPKIQSLEAEIKNLKETLNRSYEVTGYISIIFLILTFMGIWIH